MVVHLKATDPVLQAYHVTVKTGGWCSVSLMFMCQQEFSHGAILHLSLV